MLMTVMVLSLFSAPAHAYVGAMTQGEGGLVAGEQYGYTYLVNDYMGFYIRPDGNLTTVPSQMTLDEVMTLGATQSHVFYRQILDWSTDSFITERTTPLHKGTPAVTIDDSDPSNPKLVQTFQVTGYKPVTVTYELVQLDEGAVTGSTTGLIIEKDDSDKGRTWGILAKATTESTVYPEYLERVLWVVEHSGFGKVAHDLTGPARLGRYSLSRDTGDVTTRTNYSAAISSGMPRMETEEMISEVFTDSFAYANPFVAGSGYLGAYSSGAGGKTLISGIRGHWSNYASALSYEPENKSLLTAEHHFSGDDMASGLWGFRDLYAASESVNIPPDPVSLTEDAGCIGIIEENGGLSVKEAVDEAELLEEFGSSVMAVFRGSFFEKTPGDYTFINGAAQLSPSLMATWDEGSGGFSVSSDGTVRAKAVHLSVPSFKFYKPENALDESLDFSFGEGKMTVGIVPENNEAIVHIDIPGASSSVEGITVDPAGGVVFDGELSIATPVLEAANITMNRLGMGWQDDLFSLTGIEASGAVDMEQLLGLDVLSAEADINSFPGEERYAFELSLNVFDFFEAEGELELKQVYNSAIIPNTLKFKAASDIGVPLVPPTVVAEFNGLGGGFEGFADTIQGDFFAVPPIRLTVSAKGTVLEIIEGWYTLTFGPGYYKVALTDGKLLNMDIIDEYSWYMEISGDVRTYGGIDYQGLKTGGGMKMSLVIPDATTPYINAGGEIELSAFSGMDNHINPTSAYLALGANGRIFGKVNIPASAWFINRNLELASAELELALGGQTTIGVNKDTLNQGIQEGFGNIAQYGGVAYTGSLLGFPYRIYYIFMDKSVKLEVGQLGKELEPFDPDPNSLIQLSRLYADSGEQTGILVMNDNLTYLAAADSDGLSPLEVGDNDAQDDGVTLTQTDAEEKSYEISVSDTAPETDYLAFSLTPEGVTGGTIEAFMTGLEVQRTGESGPMPLVAATFNGDGGISNEDTANVILGEDSLTLMLAEKGTWSVVSDDTAFDIACYYAHPYATLSGMSLSSGRMTGNIQDMAPETNYILRTYLGTEAGETTHLLEERKLASDGVIDASLPLAGGVVPTGQYQVTTVLLEEILEDFDGDGNPESTPITTDTHAFAEKISYSNLYQPQEPGVPTLTAVGNEVMRVTWRPPAEGEAPEGYYLRLYLKDGDDWTETGANHLLKASALTADTGGDYSWEMAVTTGDAGACLAADKTYRVGVTAFKYLEEGDFPVESSEVFSGDEFLPEAVLPVLTYTPEPSGNAGQMKILPLKEPGEVTVHSDTATTISVIRMDTSEVLKQTESPADQLAFDVPDFTGALNLKITATDSQGDIAVDYLGIRLDDTPPLVTLDKASFEADYETGAFVVKGVTESLAEITVSPVDDGTVTILTWTDSTAISGRGLEYLTDRGCSLQIDTEIGTLFYPAGTLAGLVVAEGAEISFVLGKASGWNPPDSVNLPPVDPLVFEVSLLVDGEPVHELAEGITVFLEKSAIDGVEAPRLLHLLSNGSYEEPEFRWIEDRCCVCLKTLSYLLVWEAGELQGPVDNPFTDVLEKDWFYEPVLSIYRQGVMLGVGGTSFGPGASMTRAMAVTTLYRLEGHEGHHDNPFADVSRGAWYEDAVSWAVAEGITQGVGEDRFAPDSPVTREQFVALLYRYGVRQGRDMTGTPGGGDLTSCQDLQDISHYALIPLEWAASAGLIEGDDQGQLRPRDQATRAEVAAILHGFLNDSDR